MLTTTCFGIAPHPLSGILGTLLRKVSLVLAEVLSGRGSGEALPGGQEALGSGRP